LAPGGNGLGVTAITAEGNRSENNGGNKSEDSMPANLIRVFAFLGLNVALVAVLAAPYLTIQ
jgi:hypothetical protein